MALAKFFNKQNQPKTVYVDDTHEYLSKLNPDTYEIAYFFASLCPTIPIEDAFFVIKELKTLNDAGETEKSVKDNFRNFFILQKLSHADAVSEGKNKMRKFFEQKRADEEAARKRSIERQANAMEEYREAKIEGERIRKEYKDFFLTYLARPSARTATPTEEEFRKIAYIKSAFGPEVEVAKIGWFDPRWQFRNQRQAESAYNKMMGARADQVGHLLKYGTVPKFGVNYEARFGNIEYGI